MKLREPNRTLASGRWMARMVSCLCVVLLATMLCTIAPGCAQKGEQVAATVNGEAIPESVVTAYIEAFIDSLGYDSDQWAQYLALEETTAPKFREGVIDYYVCYLLYEQKARELGIEITDEQVDEAIASAREQLGRDDEGWARYLAGQGYTEETYRSTVAYSLLVSAVQDRELTEPVIGEEERNEFANEHILSYDGKHVVGIAFAPDDYATAEEVLRDILASDDPATAFGDAVQRCKDGELNAKGGDLGWSCLVSYGDDWSEVVDDLEEGKVYAYVYQSGDACYLLYCDDGYAPAFYRDLGIAVERMPDEIRAVFDEDLQRWMYSKTVEAYTESLRDGAEIVVNDMPSGLSYDVKPKK